jgi:hypothetical protein
MGIKTYQMKHLFVPYAIALLLKEKGFEEPCFGYYCKHRNTVVIPDQETLDKLEPFLDVFAVTCQNHFLYQSCSAPLYQQAFDFLFKKLDFKYPYLRVEIFSDGSGSWNQPKDDGNDELNVDFDNIDQAIEEALKLI